MIKKVLFIDRDGTIIKEPPVTFQVDTLEQLTPLPGVIRNLYRISKELGYELVMVTNQDGLGTDKYPEVGFNIIHNKLMELLEGEDIHFSAVHIDRTYPEDHMDTRKPGIGMLRGYLNGGYDIPHSFVIGDRNTDVQLAANLGAGAILIKNYDVPDTANKIDLIADHWDQVYLFLKSAHRKVVHARNTSETKIRVALNPDGAGAFKIHTGIGFFDHMLAQLAKHSGMDLEITVEGDLHIDEHHTIEDTAITLGEALAQSLGDKRGIERYGFCLPMDDALVQVAIDFGGRSWIEWDASFSREMIGGMPTEMFYHFFKSFTDGARCNLNIKAEGDNEHHKIEAIFKALAKAIKMAVRVDSTNLQLPTTKGIL